MPKMEIGKVYRQNSTGNKVRCIGHDQGGCVVRYLEIMPDKRGYNHYFLRNGQVGKAKICWTEVPPVKRVIQKVVFDQFSQNILCYNGESEELNVAFTFEGNKLVNVTML